MIKGISLPAMKLIRHAVRNGRPAYTFGVWEFAVIVKEREVLVSIVELKVRKQPDHRAVEEIMAAVATRRIFMEIGRQPLKAVFVSMRSNR